MRRVAHPDENYPVACAIYEAYIHMDCTGKKSIDVRVDDNVMCSVKNEKPDILSLIFHIDGHPVRNARKGMRMDMYIRGIREGEIVANITSYLPTTESAIKEMMGA